MKALWGRMISLLLSIQAFLALEFSMSLLNFITKKTPVNPSCKLSCFQSFLLTLMKLRHNTSNYDLGFRFHIHEATASRVLTRWLQLIDIRLSPLIKWPEREELQKTMPWCFRTHYDLKVTSIIDCFELFIENQQPWWPELQLGPLTSTIIPLNIYSA